MVGTIDWANRKSIRGSGDSRGISGIGLRTGIHTTSALTKIKAWMRKCASALRILKSTSAGQCVSTSTKLKRISAGRNRAQKRTVRNRSDGGRRMRRNIHAGVPRSSSGAATMDSTRCCTMWML